MILVPALVMGTLLVGALFYVAAVGDAIMFRTELQNAADVTAFKSAVWHARGMNVIAILNILMSLALAIFAAIRIAEIVCFILGLIPLIGTPFMTAANTLVNSERAIFNIIDSALKVVGGAQDAVSAAVPYVAMADAKATPTAAHTVWPLSMALVPPQVDRSILRQPARRPDYLPAALPIEPDKFGTLCAKATTFIPKQVASLIARTGMPFSDKFKDVADVILDDIGGKVISAGDGIFCQPINGMISKLVGLVTDSACDQVRKHDDQAEDEKAAQEEQARADSAGASGEQVDLEKEKERKKERSEKRADGKKREAIDCEEGVASAVDNATDALTFDATPSIVWSPAGNGNVFMHSWSWAEGSPHLFAANQQRIGRAGRGLLPQVTPGTSAVAMAEYYFDCSEGWDNEHCERDALWEPNWTARMRRFRSPGEEILRIGLDFGHEILETMQQSVGDHATEIIGGAMQRFTGIHNDNGLARWFGEQIDEIPVVRELSEKIDSAVGGMRDATGVDDLLDPRRYTHPDRIH